MPMMSSKEMKRQCLAAGILALLRWKRLSVCLGVKNIEKPCRGKPNARFDEGGLANAAMAGLMRHRQTKGAATVRLGLRERYVCSLLYPFSLQAEMN